jgi:DNA-binding SARP family transcriptional activator
MRFGVLGPVEVWVEGRPVAVGGPQQRALLAVLLLNANRVVSLDRLAEYLWADQPPAAARGLLQGCVAGLRRVLRTGGGAAGQPAAGQPLVTRAPGYLLRVEPGELDLDRFEELAAAAAAAGPAPAAELLAEALGLWRGPALGDIDLDGCRAEVARLEERRLAVLEERIDADLRLGRYPEPIGELRVLVEAHPLRERLWAQLMVALHGADRQADALAAYRRLRRTLVEQLGVEPGGTVRDLHQAILSGADALGEYLRSRGTAPGADPGPPGPRAATGADRAVPAAPGPAGVVVPAQLPAPPAAFTGRAAALKRLDELLPGAERGVTIGVISGMAGIGKSALAVQWAHRARDRFPDGQLHVDLRGYAPQAPLRPIEALAGFLQALGVPAGQVPVEVEPAAGLYRSLLADRKVLVLLDNAYGVEQVRPLLPGGTGCLVLVTSRDRLGGLVAHEGAEHLRLDVLDAAEARTLLTRILTTERVAAEPEATDELAGQCALLPLALRIAAANLTLHPRRRIADQVADLASGNRLGALAVDGDEQGAVGAAFDLSYAALAPDERRLFRLLGLVPGPHVTVAAAAALGGVPAADAARLLGRLSGGHLLDQPAADRYAFHDLLRRYAADRVREEDPAADRAAATERLLDWYLRAADTARDLLYPEVLRLPAPPGPPVADFADHTEALAWLEAERPNLLAAVRHAAAHGPLPFAYRMADALHGYYWLRMYPVEWLAVAGAALAAAEADGDLPGQVVAQRALADAHMRLSRYDVATDRYTRALALAGRTGWVQAECAALNGLGSMYRRLQRLPEAVDAYQRALALNRKSGWLAGQAANLGNLGIIFGEVGRLRESADYTAQALAIYRETGAHSKEAIGLGVLGEVCHLLGRLDEAEEILTRALERRRQVGDRSGETDSLRTLAAVHRDAGRYARALEFAAAAASLAREIKEFGYEPDAIVMLGTVLDRLGRHEEALQQCEEALRLARETGARPHEVAALIAAAEAQHHLGRLEEAGGRAGRAVELARAGQFRVLEGQALTTLAAIELAAGAPDAAAGHAAAAVAIHRDTGHRLGEARSLVTLGRLRRHAGDAPAAAALWDQAMVLLRDIGAAGEVARVRTLIQAG